MTLSINNFNFNQPPQITNVQVPNSKTSSSAAVKARYLVSDAGAHNQKFNHSILEEEGNE